jgi:two-component system OmpR family sensor kinase
VTKNPAVSRAVLLGLAIVLGVLACVSAAIYGLVAGGLANNQDKTLTARATAAQKEIATAPPSAFVTATPPVPLDPAVDNEVFVIVTDASGTPLTWTGGHDPSLPADVIARAATAPTSATITVDGIPVRVRVVPWHRPDLAKDGFVAAAQPIRSRKSDLAGIGVVIIVSGAVTLLAAAIGIWWVSRRLQLAHRRTADALAGQQRFTADASHELRTPLTTIRGNASFLRANPEAAAHDRAAAIGDIEAEAVRMSRLVDDLLTLARADGGAMLRPAPVDVGALAHDVCRQAGAQHPDRKIHCAGTPTVLHADGDALTQLLRILLDNAVRHAGDGGNVWVSVTSRGPHAATIQVADDGEGIPAGEERHIFERFVQADPSRRHGGAGLGLSIAQWIASAHRGGITATNNDRGGATLTVAVSSIS